MSKLSPKHVNKSIIFPMIGAALSAAMNGWYGWQWDPFTISGAGLAAGALVADGIKPTLAPAIVADWRNGARGASLMKAVFLLLLVTISSFTAFSFVSSATEATTGPARQHELEWMELKQQKENMLESLDRMDIVRSIDEIKADMKAIRSIPVKTRKGRSTVGFLMECGKVGTIDYGPVSEKYCPKIDALRQELTRSINKQKVISVITRIETKMNKIGAPVEIDPGAARAASLIGISKNDMRTIMLALMALAVELIATFGQLLGKTAAPRPGKRPSRPKTVHEWLITHADTSGHLKASYDEIARALGMSRATAWRHARKLIDAGLVKSEDGEFVIA